MPPRVGEEVQAVLRRGDSELTLEGDLSHVAFGIGTSQFFAAAYSHPSRHLSCTYYQVLGSPRQPVKVL